MDGPVKIGRGEPEQRPRRLLRTMIGEVLRKTRLAQGRTLADVARAARVSMPYLSEVERGRKEASSEVLAAICDALRLDLSELLAGSAAAWPTTGPGGPRSSGWGRSRAAGPRRKPVAPETPCASWRPDQPVPARPARASGVTARLVMTSSARP